MQKPPWFHKKIDLASCGGLKNLLRKSQLHTVCEESLCPNISTCFRDGVVTFMILGDRCTRNCSFCNIKRGGPYFYDLNEPKRISDIVRKLNLEYIVITSPSRDDLKDCGAELFCRTVKEIKNISLNKKVEILIPDFLGKTELLKKVALSGADVIAHNLETGPSLYIKIRPEADYGRSLSVLKTIKKNNKQVFTKSSLMLGLGESTREVLSVLEDLISVKCDFLTLGQYLPPSLAHYPLKNYIHPRRFKYFETMALRMGFKAVKSTPYARSSYLAYSLFKATSSKN